MLRIIFCLILSGEILVRSAPVVSNDKLNIALARLYDQFEQVRLLLNPQPDVITLVSKRIAQKFKSSSQEFPSDQSYDDQDESKTVYVNLNINSRRKTEESESEESGTKFINLFIDSRAQVFRQYTNTDDDDNSVDIETKIVYLSIDTIRPSGSYPSYHRYYRHRRQT